MGQAAQADVPTVVLLYVPAKHAVHTDDSVAPNTALKTPTPHPVHAVAAGMLPYAPAKQLVHAEVPVATELYMPAAHAVHTVNSLAPTTAL